MAGVDKSSKGRFSRRSVDRFGARREELADAAIQTLATLGYARTSLREIAQNTDSHGSLHYYFEDKLDLILCCVSRYKQACIARYDVLMERCHTADEVRFGLATALAVSIRDDGWLHRLWYDLRSQALFDEERLADAALDIDGRLEQMIWRFVSRFAELSGTVTIADPHLAYSTLDGLFVRALLHHFGGREDALDTLQRQVADVMLTMVKQS